MDSSVMLFQIFLLTADFSRKSNKLWHFSMNNLSEVLKYKHLVNLMQRHLSSNLSLNPPWHSFSLT